MKITITLTLATLILLMSRSVFPQSTTYSYIGDYYVQPNPPFDTSMRVEGSFTTSSPLPPNMPLTNIGPGGDMRVVSWTFSDGATVYSNENSLPFGAPPYTFFDVSTDAQGNIEGFSIAVASPMPPHFVGQALDVFWITTDTGGFAWTLAEHQEPCVAVSDDQFWDVSGRCWATNPASQTAQFFQNGVWTIDGLGVMGCDQYEGKLGGICNAFCEGVNCDEDDSSKSCEVLARNFTKLGGASTVPPCADSPTGG